MGTNGFMRAAALAVMLPDVTKGDHGFTILLTTQGIFFNAFFLAYIISPRVCHAFIGCVPSPQALTMLNTLSSCYRQLLMAACYRCCAEADSAGTCHKLWPCQVILCVEQLWKCKVHCKQLRTHCAYVCLLRYLEEQAVITCAQPVSHFSVYEYGLPLASVAAPAC